MNHPRKNHQPTPRFKWNCFSCSDSHQTMLFSHIAPVFPNRILPGNTSKMASWLTFDTKEVLSHQNSKASSSHQTPFHQFPTCLLASKLAISQPMCHSPLVHPATKIFSRSQVHMESEKAWMKKLQPRAWPAALSSTGATASCWGWCVHMCSWVKKINGSEHYSKPSKFR